MRSIHRTRIVSFSNDSSKSDGRHCKATWLCRARRRRSICLHPSQNGGRSKVVKKNPESELSRYMETSWTTQVAQIMVKHRRTQWFFSNEMCTITRMLASCGKDSSRKFCGCWEKSTEFGMSFCSPKNKNDSYRYMDDINMAGKNRRWLPRRRNRWNLWTSENQHHFLTTCILDALNVNVKRTKLFLIKKEKSNMTRVGETSRKDSRMVLRHGRTCSKVRRKVLWTGKQKERTLVQSFNSMLGWAQIQKEELEAVGELSNVCYHIVLQCLYLARIGRPDIRWPENKLARAVTKWTRACDKRLARLISYIHHTDDYRLYCHVGNTAQHCRLGFFQHSDFAEDLVDSKSTSEGILCIFGSRTFVPISWMCKKQTSVSQSSTESEVNSLDAGLRMDGIPAFDLWDVVIEGLRSTNNTERPIIPAPGNWCGQETIRAIKPRPQHQLA